MAALSTAFFITGAAGLIFQVIWFYRCGLVFGNSVWAVAVVLSSFMGGLALGSALAGRYAGRMPRLLLAYATLEVVVAVSGVAAAFLLPELTSILVPFTRWVGQHSALVNVIRLCAAFAVLAVPATAMGATLPVIVGAILRASINGRGVAEGAFGRVLGRLYGWNTLGAMAGVIAAEVLLIDRLGVGGAALAAAFLNVCAAIVALWVSRRLDNDDGTTGKSSSDLPKPARMTRAEFDIRSPTALLFCALLGGGSLLALEVVWFRFLSMYVLSTTLAVSLMLAVVLAAIGLGGLVTSTWLRRRPAAAGHLPSVAFVAGCALTVSYLAFQTLTAGTQVGEWYRVLWFAGALAFPTSFLSGVLFTLTGDALQRATGTDVRAAAWLVVANTIGALIGPPVAGFVLLPAFGMERTFVGIALAYGAIGLLALWAVRGNTRVSAVGPRRTCLAGGLALGIAILSFPSGLMRDNYFLRVAHAYAADGSEIVATREGPSETIFLMRQQWMGRRIYDRLVTNGFSMSGTEVPGMRYMRYFAYWPMVLHSGPVRRALVICYGVGITVGAVADIPSIESIDVVEISPDIVAMSDVIYAPDRHPLRDPRVHMHFEDGRYFLQTTSERFDLITGEPPPPRTPGAVNIYTREYFRLIYDRLAEGGITTYWLPVARPDPGTDVDTIIRAFCDVFDDCSLWNATPFDLMLVGSRETTGPTAEADFGRAWQTSGLETRLREVGFEQPEQIGATFLGDVDYLRSLTANTPPLTDDFPQRLRPSHARPSLSGPQYVDQPSVSERYQSVIDPGRAREAFAASDFIRRLWPPSLIDRTLPFFEHQRIMNRVFWEGGRPLRQIEDLHAVLTQTSLRTLPLWILGTDHVKQEIAENVDDGSGAIPYARGLSALAERDYPLAAVHFAEAERRGLQSPNVRALQVYALCAAGMAKDARQLARGIQPREPDELHFWAWIGPECGAGPFSRADGTPK